MQTPLNASASTAGGLLSSATFEVPPFQREYSWKDDEVREFFRDLQASLDSESYFLGLVILTDEGGRKQIVDGQQRLVTLTLLAAALFHEARNRGRSALADRLQADFLKSINYDTDENDPRVILTDEADNATLQAIIKNGLSAERPSGSESVSSQMYASYETILRLLNVDLSPDPFKRLGKWTEFITHKLYFAVFVHPDPATAYQVFEVINTRGRDLTTADLLKNYVISQAPKPNKAEIYRRWKNISQNFPSDGANNFVQYIRHVATISAGHILPRDLFAFLAGRVRYISKSPPSALELVDELEMRLPQYLQMVDPTLPGPSNLDQLRVFSALNKLGVIAVRPLAMAVCELEDAQYGLEELLKIVVRRIVVGNLGTGNIERRFSDAARRVSESRSVTPITRDLADLSPTKQEFVEQLSKRSYNKDTLAFVRNSSVTRSIAPAEYFPLHFVMPRATGVWPGFDDDERSYWTSTIGNTFLSTSARRAEDSNSWESFKRTMLPSAAPEEFLDVLDEVTNWDAEAVRKVGYLVARAAGEVWYG